MPVRAFIPHPAILALLVVAGFILYGGLVIRLVGAFVVFRLTKIVTEFAAKPVTEEEWNSRKATLASEFSHCSPEELGAFAEAFGFPPCATATDLADASIARQRTSYIAPRNRPELFAEVLGLIAFCVLIPLNAGLLTEPLFFFKRPLEMVDVAVLASCIVLYSLPLFHRLVFRESTARLFWWAIPFFPGLIVMLFSIAFSHPYLNPFNPDHRRLAADHIIALKRSGNNIVAASHVDWIFRYAKDLEKHGDKEAAARYYREGLELDANDRNAVIRLEALDPLAGLSTSEVRSIDQFAPLWPEGAVLPSVPRQRLDESLGDLRELTIVIVPIGDIQCPLLDAVGYAMRNELGLSVVVSDPITLPPADRMHGLAVGSQWNADSMVRAFVEAHPSLPPAPVRFLILTDRDIYMERSNFVFSASSVSFGAVVSAARFISMDPSEFPILHCTAKQSLCAILKCFGLPASPDRDCVTSYVRSLEEFDVKGNRPNSRTLALFQKTLLDLHRGGP